MSRADFGEVEAWEGEGFAGVLVVCGIVGMLEGFWRRRRRWWFFIWIFRSFSIVAVKLGLGLALAVMVAITVVEIRS